MSETYNEAHFNQTSTDLTYFENDFRRQPPDGASRRKLPFAEKVPFILEHALPSS